MASLFANWKSGRSEGSTVRAEDLAEALREGRPVHLDGAIAIPGLGLTYSGYALLISSISWVLVPLFLTGLTGIVRQRQ